jgi:hypothetical protein
VAVLVPTAPVIEEVPQSHAPHAAQEPQPPEQSGAVHAAQDGAGQAVGLEILVPPETQATVPEDMLLYSPYPAALNALTLIL